MLPLIFIEFLGFIQHSQFIWYRLYIFDSFKKNENKNKRSKAALRQERSKAEWISIRRNTT